MLEVLDELERDPVEPDDKAILLTSMTELSKLGEGETKLSREVYDLFGDELDL